MRGVGRAAVAFVGLCALGFATALAVAPAQVDGVLPVEVLAGSTPLSAAPLRALGFGLVGGLCVLWVAWTAGPDRTRALPEGTFSAADSDFGTLRSDPPEHASAVRLAGEEFDRRLVRAAAAASGAPGGDDARGEVRSLAVAVVAEVEGCPDDVARERVRSGEWTDDEIAAAYVADREASLPFYRRLLAWLRPARTTGNRVERSITAVENRLEEGEY